MNSLKSLKAMDGDTMVCSICNTSQIMDSWILLEAPWFKAEKCCLQNDGKGLKQQRAKGSEGLP